MSDTISVDYARMRQVSSKFSTHAEVIKQLHSEVMNQVQLLQNGKWIADAANKYYDSMNTQVLVGVHKLDQALAHAAEVSTTIINEMGTAEEQARACLPTD